MFVPNGFGESVMAGEITLNVAVLESTNVSPLGTRTFTLTLPRVVMADPGILTTRC
jgi:hypothetical protein